MAKRLFRVSLNSFKYDFEYKLPQEIDLVFESGKVMHGYLEKCQEGKLFFKDSVRNKHVFQDIEIAEVVYSIEV